MTTNERPVLLVLASTYPRWKDDHEPGFVHELAKRLVDRFRVIVLCPHAAGALPRETMDDVEIVRYRYAPERLETLVNDGGIVNNLRRSSLKLLLVPGFVMAQAWQAWRLLRRENVDVIHAHWLVPQGVIAALFNALSGNRVPFVVTSHGADLYALHGKLMNHAKRFVLRRSHAATVVSGAMRETLRALGADVAKVSVQPMGVDTRDRFGMDASVPRSRLEILFVGRLVEKKGLRYLLDAMPGITRRVPGVQLTVAGFGPEEESLKAQARALGVERAVRFLGAVPQTGLPALYRGAALLVAPFVEATSGDQEGLGLVLVEAISCGCPILAGNVPAMAEVLGGKFDDMIIDPRDRDAFANRIVGLLIDPEVAQARVRLLREAIGKRFDWDEVAGNYSHMLMQGISMGRDGH